MERHGRGEFIHLLRSWRDLTFTSTGIISLSLSRD